MLFLPDTYELKVYGKFYSEESRRLKKKILFEKGIGGTPSDAYLFGFYDKKELLLSHQEEGTVNFTIEFDPTGNGDWMVYDTVAVAAGETSIHLFPQALEARWIRFVTDKDAKVTTWLEYK